MVGVCPSAQPAIYEDFWDTSHVKMPCSESNIYPMKSEVRNQIWIQNCKFLTWNLTYKIFQQGKSFLKQRWNLVQFAFSKFISNSLDLEKAILSYNSRYDGIWNFQGLHTLFSKVHLYWIFLCISEIIITKCFTFLGIVTWRVWEIFL